MLFGSIAVTTKLGINSDKIKAGIAEVVIPDRFEIVENSLEIPVVIDYANTPESLESVLKAARTYTTGRITVVFGCEGERNEDLREQMGKVAGKFADRVVITTFNPRFEDPKKIAEEVLKGVKKVEGKANIILDRKKAIIFPLEKAQKRDMIIITGLGHNNFMEVLDQKIVINEKEIVQKYFENIKTNKEETW